MLGVYQTCLFVAVDTVQLDAEVSAAVTAAWSSNTLATRNSQWSKYFAFCRDINQVPLPATSQTVSRFLVFLGRTCKYSTINNYLSAVVALHKFYGYPSEFRTSYLIKMLLRGLKAQLGDMTIQMQPLSVEQLERIHSDVVSTELDKTIWAMLILSFRSLLRKSNLVPDAPDKLVHVLCRKDLVFYHWGLLLRVRSTKTLQCNEYVLEIPIYYVDNPVFCAASMVREHLAKYPIHDDCPIFVKQGQTSLEVLLYREVLSFIKGAVEMIGLDPAEYGTHSMRRSGASFMHSNGIPLEDIMVMGDWRSLAVLDYLVTPMSRKVEIQKALCSVKCFKR